jgi:predicted AAA+ superfamily ATPase
MDPIERPAYLNKLAGYIDAPVAKVLTGVRRAGKSTLLALLRSRLDAAGKGPVIELNFDLLENAGLCEATALNTYIGAHAPAAGRFYVLLDEVQEVAGWEHVVTSLLAQGRADIYLTGSNSRLLSSELATYIAGRYVSFEVSTLSFAEYVDFAERTGLSTDDTDALFRRYLVRGGFPGLFAADYSDEQARQIVSDIYASALIRDVLTRRAIRSPELFERVARYALDNVGNTFSARRVSDFLKSESKTVSHQTVADYLAALCDAFLLRKVSRFDLRGRAVLATQEKYYAGDHGLINALLGYSTTRLPGILENIVQAELRLRGYDITVGKLGDAEVDFVARRRDERMYLQVATSVLDPETRRREFAPLLAIRDSYPKYVLSLDDLAGGSDNGVRHRRVPDFLLDQSW